jgi:4-hydroxy-tetrahydrodipicolinate synthase
MPNHPLSGVYAAAVTPLNLDGSIALDDIPQLLAFLAKRGCHGALVLGTTGEGPSFSVSERLVIYQAALRVREVYPEFRLLAGTGTPSLEETVGITKSVFELGFNAAVVLPPYFYHQATEDGLYQWFQELVKRAVPRDGYLLGYHFPAQCGVPIPAGVLSRLRVSFPGQFIGIKDSSANAEHAHRIGDTLDEDIVALVGNDKLFSQALEAGSSGCITGLANLHSPILRQIWEAHQVGASTSAAQAEILAKRSILDRYQPFAPTIKALLSAQHGFPPWTLRLPLTPLPEDRLDQLLQDMNAS